MSTFAIDRSTSGPSFRGRASAPPPRLRSFETSRRIEDRQCGIMEAAFARNGGCVTGNVLARQLRHRTGQPFSMVEGWITERTIVSFAWNSQVLVPRFQFQPADMSPCTGTTEVVRELVDVFDDWELALWFAQPNAWLENAAPVDVIGHDQAAVHRAARADRYIARG
jgi:hypothetical protein